MQEEVFEYDGSDGPHGSAAAAAAARAEQLHTFREMHRAKIDPFDVSGAVTATSVAPADAFEVFQGKAFYNSGSSSGSGGSSGTEYRYLDSVEQRAETPLQRFTRLRVELTELQADLDSMAEVQGDGGGMHTFAPSALQRPHFPRPTSPRPPSHWPERGTRRRHVVGHVAPGSAGTGRDCRRAGRARRLRRLRPSPRHRHRPAASSHRPHGRCCRPRPPAASSSAPSSSASAEHTATAAGGAEGNGDFVTLERRVFALETFLGSAPSVLGSEGDGAIALGGGGGGRLPLPLAALVARLETQLASLDAPALEVLQPWTYPLPLALSLPLSLSFSLLALALSLSSTSLQPSPRTRTAARTAGPACTCRGRQSRVGRAREKQAHGRRGAPAGGSGARG